MPLKSHGTGERNKREVIHETGKGDFSKAAAWQDPKKEDGTHLNKSESKYFATADRMDEALLKLLERKDLAYITVKEVCEVAGVNRSTFYLHYESMTDLLSESADI